MADPSRFVIEGRYVTLTRVSDTCLCRSWPLYLSQSLESLRFAEETTFRRTRPFPIKYGGRSFVLSNAALKS